MDGLIAFGLFANFIGFVFCIAIIVWSYIQWHNFMDTQRKIANAVERLADYKRIELSKNHHSDRIDNHL